MAGKRPREQDSKGAEVKPCSDKFSYNRDLNALKRKWEPQEEDDIWSGFECLDFPHESVASPPTCARTCEVCHAQYRPLQWQKSFGVLRYTSKYYDQQAADLVKDLILDTQVKSISLEQSLSSHGNAIMKRWLKRTHAKRKDLILEAMPGMLRERIDGPDFSRLCCEPLSKVRAGLLLPWLNAAKLSEEPLNLLALMHYRISSHPSEWVMHDSEHIKAFFTQGTLEAEYNPHCVKMFGDDDTFGSMTQWEKDAAHRWEIIGFPRAKLILEAQNLLFTFLENMVSLLLGPKPQEVQTGRNKWDELVATDFKVDDQTSNAPTFRTISFCSAPKLSISNMLESFRTRLAAARDEAWLVQTDPAFAKQLLATAVSSECNTAASADSRQKRLIGLMSNYILGPGKWQGFLSALEEADGLCRRNNYDFEIGRQPPEDFAYSLRTLEYALMNEFSTLVNRIRNLAMQFGLMDKHFKFGKEAGDMEKKHNHIRRDPLVAGLDQLNRHDDCDARDPGHALEALDHVFRTVYSNRTPQVMTDCLSDMYTMNEALMAIRHSRPSTAPMMSFPEYEKAYSQRDWWRCDLWRDFIARNWQSYPNDLWAKLDKFMKTPLPSTNLSVKTLEQFDASHEALNDFWNAFREMRAHILKELDCRPQYQAVVMADVEAGLSEVYSAERQYERELLLREIAKKEAKANAHTKRLAALKEQATRSVPATPVQQYWGKEDATPTWSRSKPEKEETKRKRLIAQPEAPAIRDLAEEVQDMTVDEKDSIAVSRKSMDIFTRMFVSYGKHAHGNVRWPAFVAAMADAGAIASQSAGSAVTFRAGKKAVVFHQPHPDNSVNPVMMRALGKQVTKHFDWNMDLFVERE